MGSSRYTLLVNPKTHKTVVVDNVRNRLRRLQRRIRGWCQVMDEKQAVGKKLVMVTLTYAPGKEWEPNHIRNFMLWLRKQTRVYAYTWVSELQKRGAVHYHVEVWVKKDAFIPYPDKSGGWEHGMSQVEGVKTAYYALKYSGKEYQKDFERFPKGIRAFAVWLADGVLQKHLRYMSLKVWEQQYVDTDGWESLDFWRRYERSLSGWLCWGHYDELLDAKVEGCLWDMLFDEHPLEPVERVRVVVPFEGAF